jgi:hypothetical protein
MRSICRLATCLFFVGAGLNAFGQSYSAGHVRFIQRTGSDWDQYTLTPAESFITWLNGKISRTQVYEPYFDIRLSWYSNAWAYEDLYGISIHDNLASQHPDWILRDANGNPVYVPWGCSGGACPLYAFDPGNEDFRNWWIENKGARDLKMGYKGLWIDDVNLQFMVGDNNENLTTPMDPRTGAPMTYAAWKSYMAGFTQAIRSALPTAEISHNTIWYAGGDNRDYDANVIKEIQAADYINCERGVSDWGLQSGTGNNGTNNWSLGAFLAFVDHVHSLGKHVIFQEYNYNGDGQYGVAGYLLISDGQDGYSNLEAGPDRWSPIYDADLGSALNARYSWNNLLRRDFSNGTVLLNPNYSSPVTVTLPGAFQKVLGGSTITQVTLNGGEAVLLLGHANDLTTNTAPKLADGIYQVQSQYSGFVLEAANFSVVSGTPVDQWASNGGPNQSWKFTSNANGQYTIQNVFSGLYLTDVNGALQQVLQTNDSSQLWTVKTITPGVYTLTNVASAMVIDDPKFNMDQGTPIITWSANGGANQSWLIR